MICVKKKDIGYYFVRGFFRDGNISNEFYILEPLDCFKLINEIKK